MIRTCKHYSGGLPTNLFSSLAAVDMHTAQHLVNKCLRGSLTQDRTIILVTHHITLCLPVASYLLELAQGKVLRQGLIQSFRDADLIDSVIAAEDNPSYGEEESMPRTPENEADKLGGDGGTKSHHSGKAGKLIEAESRAEGRVSIRTYITYMKAAGVLSWLLTLTLMLTIRMINIGNQVGLSSYK